MKVLSAPPITFKCVHCKAVCEGDIGEFEPLHTVPPTSRAKCGFCNMPQPVSPAPLLARHVGDMSDTDCWRYMARRML